MRIRQDNPNTLEYWNKIYSNEIKQNIRRENFDRFNKVLSLIPNETYCNLLEIGCGKGEFFEYLMQKRKLVYSGIDISRVAIEYNKENFKKGHFSCGNVNRLPFPHNFFTVVVGMEILEHIDDVKKLKEQIDKVLKPNGRFIAMLPNENKIDSTEHIWSFTLDEINEIFPSSENKVEDNYIIINYQKKAEKIMDFDDFSETNNRLDLLLELKKEIPQLKVTLFTIPGQSSLEFCQKIVNDYDWIELALHGDIHSYLECIYWNRKKSIAYLEKYEKWGCFKKIFKAPYWKGSKGLYQVLKSNKYILAENKQVKDYKKLYILNENSVHGHIQNVCGNGLQEKFNYYKSLKNNNFKFISELYE